MLFKWLCATNWLKVNRIQTIDTSDLVLKSQLPKKNLEDIGNKIPNHNKYITINGFKKFSGAVFYETLKQSKLVTLNAVEQLAIFFMVMMVLKICLFINQFLLRWI